ncbi:hypothetical protein L218DRAFT_947436 [Marasmius fiardii PR-910]|nr:hypothetical protein L218DRAFT_947436 [Marasmius fiardii PR-910]
MVSGVYNAVTAEYCPGVYGSDGPVILPFCHWQTLPVTVATIHSGTVMGGVVPDQHKTRDGPGNHTCSLGNSPALESGVAKPALLMSSEDLLYCSLYSTILLFAVYTAKLSEIWVDNDNSLGRQNEQWAVVEARGTSFNFGPISLYIPLISKVDLTVDGLGFNRLNKLEVQRKPEYQEQMQGVRTMLSFVVKKRHKYRFPRIRDLGKLPPLPEGRYKFGRRAWLSASIGVNFKNSIVASGEKERERGREMERERATREKMV